MLHERDTFQENDKDKRERHGIRNPAHPLGSRLLSSAQVTASGVQVLRKMNESGWDASQKGQGKNL